MNIILTPELETIINDQLNNGNYTDALAVIDEALQSRFVRQNNLDLSPEEIQEVREEGKKLDEEIANGTAELLDFDEVAKELAREYP